MTIKNALGRLRIIGFVEGISYLVLLLIAMPLKYIFQLPDAVRLVGMAHGILFVLYGLLVLQVAIENSWKLWETFLALLASIIPLGTFYVDKKIFKPKITIKQPI